MDILTHLYWQFAAKLINMAFQLNESPCKLFYLFSYVIIIKSITLYALAFYTTLTNTFSWLCLYCGILNLNKLTPSMSATYNIYNICDIINSLLQSGGSAPIQSLLILTRERARAHTYWTSPTKFEETDRNETCVN